MPISEKNVFVLRLDFSKNQFNSKELCQQKFHVIICLNNLIFQKIKVKFKGCQSIKYMSIHKIYVNDYLSEQVIYARWPAAAGKMKPILIANL